jgi:uncharacterized protein (DUF4415 family)
MTDDEIPQDEDNPRATEEFWKNGVVSHSYAEFRQNVAAMVEKRRAGRPPVEHPRKNTNIRLAPEVESAFRATGKGWQTRINAALSDWLKTHSPTEIA